MNGSLGWPDPLAGWEKGEEREKQDPLEVFEAEPPEPKADWGQRLSGQHIGNSHTVGKGDRLRCCVLPFLRAQRNQVSRHSCAPGRRESSRRPRRGSRVAPKELDVEKPKECFGSGV